MTKVLMVCMANICRSPMARDVARQLALDAGEAQAFEFDAAGTQAQDGGECIDPRAKSVLLSRRYPAASSRSRRVSAADFERFDLILAMDEDNLQALQEACPAQHLDKLHLLLDFAPACGETEVPDPYYGNLAGFERVLELCEAAARGLIASRSGPTQTL
jgi:protein-tyrosine phosphatase